MALGDRRLSLLGRKVIACSCYWLPLVHQAFGAGLCLGGALSFSHCRGTCGLNNDLGWHKLLPVLRGITELEWLGRGTNSSMALLPLQTSLCLLCFFTIKIESVTIFLSQHYLILSSIFSHKMYAFLQHKEPSKPTTKSSELNFCHKER